MAKSLGILAPGFLIASPPLGDPNFDRTVVLLAIHGDGGALGFVVNRPAPLSLGELLKIAGYGEQGAGNRQRDEKSFVHRKVLLRVVAREVG